MTFPSTAHSKWRPWSGDSPNSLAPCLHPEDKLASIINPYSSFFQWMWCFSFFWRIITAWVLNHRLTASPETRLTNHSLSPSYLIFTPPPAPTLYFERTYCDNLYPATHLLNYLQFHCRYYILPLNMSPCSSKKDTFLQNHNASIISKISSLSSNIHSILKIFKLSTEYHL